MGVRGLINWQIIRIKLQCLSAMFFICVPLLVTVFTILIEILTSVETIWYATINFVRLSSKRQLYRISDRCALQEDVIVKYVRL